MTTTAPTPAHVDGQAALRDGITAWLASRGLDPTHPELADTPRRVAAAWAELTSGYDDDPANHLRTTFPVEHSGQPIAVTGVPFVSVCAHHLLPFTGTASIAYLPEPGAPVAGLSKLPRVLDVYAKRLQTQEQLTRQVTTALDTHLNTRGSACIIRGEHGCLAHRGACKPGATMVTASYTGVFDSGQDALADLHTLLHP